MIECSDCHTLNDDSLGRCSACGSKLDRSSYRQPWERTATPYLIFIACLGVVLAMLHFYFHMI